MHSTSRQLIQRDSRSLTTRGKAFILQADIREYNKDILKNLNVLIALFLNVTMIFNCRIGSS